jgi:hypothetical protein
VTLVVCLFFVLAINCRGFVMSLYGDSSVSFLYHLPHSPLTSFTGFTSFIFSKPRENINKT